ncbi:uncharacterized protein G2W53_027279 [Senna tora]|uniref:Uncharacterized protein n=1 Tax=Senna tora TaxID=362788 RepID=A0A834WM34_9FABA|nr:uncharacterized protein G2W53_027279 [Senna tora]
MMARFLLRIVVRVDLLLGVQILRSLSLFLFFEQVVPKRTYPSSDGRRAYMWWRSVLLLLFKVGSYAVKWRRARKESMMLLLKVPVTSMEGDDDGTSYAAATRKEGVNDAMLLLKVLVTSMEGDDDGTSYAVQAEQEVEAGMGVVDNNTTKGSNYMRERSQRWHYRRFQ